MDFMAKKYGQTVTALFLIINGIVLYNAIAHYPLVGYDSLSHIKNIIVYSQGRLPVREDSYVYYMSPFSYALPIMLRIFTKIPFFMILKLTQMLNVVYSIGVTLYTLKICEIIRPGNRYLKTLSLAFLGMMPVYYKTFAFIRAEPMIAFITIFAVYYTLRVFVSGEQSRKNIVLLGLVLGVGILARKTVFVVSGGIGLFAIMLAVKYKKVSFVRTISLVAIITILVGGWYYTSNLLRADKAGAKGTLLNFPSRSSFSLSNQPRKFYFGTGNGKLFTAPVRKNFPEQFIPIFYSEFWGDYLNYFYVYGKNKSRHRFVTGVPFEMIVMSDNRPAWFETNREKVMGYLGRVNFVSLFPSFFLAMGVILGMLYLAKGIFRRVDVDDICIKFSLLEIMILTSAFAFMYYLIMYPAPGKGDNAKATYLIHILPAVAILAGDCVWRIRQRSVMVYSVVCAILVMVAVHNLSVLFTQYSYWRLFTQYSSWRLF